MTSEARVEIRKPASVDRDAGDICAGIAPLPDTDVAIESPNLGDEPLQGCGAFEQFSADRRANIAHAKEHPSTARGYDFSRRLREAQGAYDKVIDPEGDAVVSKRLRRALAAEFIAAGFCPRLSGVAPAVLYDRGHLYDCAWIQQQVALSDIGEEVTSPI